MQELLGCAGVRVTMIHTPVPNRDVRGVGSPADVLRAGSAWITASGCSDRAAGATWPRRRATSIRRPPGGLGVVAPRMAGGAVERYAAVSRIPFRGDAVQIGVSQTINMSDVTNGKV